ncbi:MAG: Na+/H+ antiporter NhaC [Provencibacterium sp.]|jgi:NhaC family Na+:H+ antiporter|nr:Na+/H+ antiporter NhaC [Provencibacterium sp.]
MARPNKQAPLWLALGTLIFLVVVIVGLSLWLKAPPHLPLLLGTIAAGLAGVYCRFGWKQLQEGMIETIKAALPALLIIMTIGVLIASWMLGGIIPSMIYYGLRLISPKAFLVTTLLLCSVVSLAVGSSLSTIGTVGVALFAIGGALGVPPAVTAGAIVSGAYFGDKMSPLSDTTNLAPSVSGADLFDHIRHMTATTVPTYIICLFLYGGLGLFYASRSGAADTAQVAEITGTLQQTFVIHPLLLLPVLLVIAMVLLRIPALPGLLLAAALGLVCAVFVQGAEASSISNALMSGYAGATGSAAVDTLLNRGGIMGMMRTVALMVIALCFAGIFERTGMARAIVERILGHVHSDRGLVVSAILTSWLILLGTGQQYVAIIITGRLFRSSFEERRLAPQNLSRALEDAGTVFGGIVPHSTGAGFTMDALGMSAWQYGPFTFFGWINPLVSIALALSGRSMPHTGEEKKRPGARR